jgi:hypothetical protein
MFDAVQRLPYRHGTRAEGLRQFGNFQLLAGLEAAAHELVAQRRIHPLLHGFTRNAYQAEVILTSHASRFDL